MDTPVNIHEGLAHHRAGRLAEAEQIYRQILSQQPNQPDALHLLGLVASQVGRLDAAAELIGKAIAIRPTMAEYYGNLGPVYRRMGQLERAVEALRVAVRLKPDYAEAHNNLGAALRDMGRVDQAIEEYFTAIRLKPDFSEASNNLGNALQDKGDYEGAIAAFKRAIAQKSDQVQSYYNLGITLNRVMCWNEGIDALSQALRLKPDYAEAYNDLGTALLASGRTDEAVAAHTRAIELHPGFADAHNNLGNAFRSRGDMDRAITAFRAAIAIKPELPEAHGNLGIALMESGQINDAVAEYSKALELKPDYAEAHNNLGNALKEQGKLDEGLEELRTAVRLQPTSAAIGSNLLSTLYFHPDYDAAAILKEHLQWAERHESPLSAGIKPHLNDRNAERRLRIGYVSPDFRGHPVGRSFRRFFGHHDRKRFEIFCYSDVRHADQITQWMKERTDIWRQTDGLSDQQLAEQIRGDRIDLLVDSTLHTAGNRLLAFARKPAPIQLTLLGPPETTGLAAMDYRITDRYLDPPGETDQYYTERSIRLPHSFWCYEPWVETATINELPALGAGHVTFASLNSFVKVTGAAMKVWATILRAVPDSRLVIRSDAGSHWERVLSAFEEEDIARGRVEFVATASKDNYARLFHQVDICLDPFPFSGHTTGMDSLWMGVPFVTLAGGTSVSRGGVSILSNVGMPELIARSEEQYVAIAVALAGDLPKLAELRSLLRSRIESSPLMDGKQFAGELEAIYRRIWREWVER